MAPLPINPDPAGYLPSTAIPDKPKGDQRLRVILEQGGMFGKFGRTLPWLLLGIALFALMGVYGRYQTYMQTNARIDERFHSLNPQATDKIAIIHIDGPIMHSDGFAKWQIDQVQADDSIKAVVIRVDSPGGTITGSDYLYHHLKKLRDPSGRNLPLVVSMGGMAASGGYYVSMAVGDQPDTIFAEPTTWTGSIGVIIPHFDLTGLLQSWNVKDDSIASNPLKQMGSLTRRPPPEIAEKERQILNELVQQSFDDFKEIVKSGRPKLAQNPELLTAATTGQIFTAKQAEKLGLVDKLGFVEDAISRAVALANLQPDSVRVVQYRRPATLLDVFEGPLGSAEKGKLTALLDLAAPRAYYLCSWLPHLAASGSPD